MSNFGSELVGETTMVKIFELETEVIEQREKNRLLEDALEVVRDKLDEVAKTARKMKEKLEITEEKGKKVEEEDYVPEPNPPLQEEPFPRVIKALGGKPLEGIPFFTGKMDSELIMEWIEGIENYFECVSISEAQKMKVSKSRLRGPALTWWKFLQEEREREGK